MTNTVVKPPSKLLSVQAARGVAAVLVILFHDSMAVFTHPEYWPRDPMHRLFASGHLGVELFFVISGFIILQAHWRDVGFPERLRLYAVKRALRIYPVYWIVLLALLPVYALEPHFGTGQELGWRTLLSSFALVRFGTSSVVLAVSWTLFFEVVFYAAFAFLILGRRIGVVVLGLWWSLVLLSLATGGLGASGFYVLRPVTLLFGFGMATALLYRHDRIAAPFALAVLGSALFVANGLFETYGPGVPETLTSLVAGLSAAVALAGCVELERRGRLRVPPSLASVGDASYSIYLVHFPVLSLAAKILLRPMLRAAPPLAAELALAALALAAGIAFHRAVERPLLARLSRGRTRVAPALMGPVTS